MKRSSLFALWGILYIICAGLGFIPDAAGSVRIFLMLISVLFFVPPAILLWDAMESRDAKTVRYIRLLSAASLGATVLLVVLSIATAASGELLGNLLHILLAICSTPMFCSNYWVLSLFLWAVLLVASFQKGRKS